MSAPSLSSSSSSSAAASASTQLSAEEAAIYDRQLRVWGVDAQKRMRSASVCIVGINGLGAEVAKNIVLAGIGSLTLLDPRNTTPSDLSAQFLLTQEDIGHNRATASARRLTLLNPSVQLTCDESEPDAKEIDWWHQFQAVIVMDAARHTQLRIHRACRLHKIQSVNCWIADSAGMFAYFLEDLHHHQYTVTQKEDKENPSTEQPKTTQHTVTYAAMESVLSLPWSSILTAFGVRHAPSAFIYLLLTTLAQYRDTFVDWPPTKDDKHKALYRDLISQHLAKAQLSASTIPDELIETVWRCAGLQLSPVCAIAGGYLGQEILKVLSGRDEPLQNVFVYNGNLSHALIKHVR